MSDLKNQIFTLLKKCPKDVYISSETNNVSATYYNDHNSIFYGINLIYSDRAIYFDISSNMSYTRKIDVTEKEYMELKWTIEEWAKILEEKAFEDFKEFAETEPNSMDDLLND